MSNQKQSVVEKVYQFCLEKIEAGEWKTGEKIPSETELNKILGISKVSIRAALQMLRTQGYIVTYHGKGSFVSSYLEGNISGNNKIIVNFTEKQLLDFTEFREAIEIKALELAIMNGTQEEMKNLETILERMKSCLNNYVKYSKYDAEFHMAIFHMTHNSIIINAAELIRSEYFHYLNECNRLFSQETLDDSLRLHKQLYEAIVMRDIKLATSFITINLRRNILRIGKKIEGADMANYPLI